MARTIYLNIEDVLRCADGTLADTRVRLDHLDLEALCDLLITELAARCSLPGARPAISINIRFEFAHAGRSFARALAIDAAAAAILAPPEEVPVVIRQELGEALRSLYGTSARGEDATREVWIINEPGPASDDPEDPWLALLRNSTLAAGCAVSALARSSRDVGELARHFGSDKWGDHMFTDAYEAHFAPFRRERIRLLEIGIGGFESPRSGGESLRMWKHFFPAGLIFGLDIFDKSPLDELRIRTLVGDQSDADRLIEITAQHGPFDIVIDDGSHVSDHVITAFNILFPLLQDGGLYVIEDLQTAYWPGWNGGRLDLDDPGTSTGSLKALIDALHHRDQIQSLPPQLEKLGAMVRTIHVSRNFAVIEKGLNNGQTAPSWVRRDENDMDLSPKGSMKRIR